MIMKRTNYLIICAMQEELDGILAKERNYKKLSDDLYLVDSENYSLFLMLSGIGKVASSCKLSKILANYVIDHIINVGVAGSISPKLKVFDTLIATKCAYHDVDVTAFGYEYGQMAQMPLYYECDSKLLDKIDKNRLTLQTGLIISGDSFIDTKNFKSTFYEKFDDPLACDMESAAICQVAYMNHIPVNIIRTISDSVGYIVNNKDQYEHNLKKACSVAGDLISELILDSKIA